MRHHGNRSLEPSPVRRRLVLLLLVGCLPSLLLNAGMGRSVLIHDYEDQWLHTHLVSDSHSHQADLHDRLHGHHDVPPHEHSDTVIRGTDIGITKKHESAQAIAVDFLLPVLIVVSPLTSPTSSSFPSPGTAADSPPAQLASLSTIILLT